MRPAGGHVFLPPDRKAVRVDGQNRDANQKSHVCQALPLDVTHRGTGGVNAAVARLKTAKLPTLQVDGSSVKESLRDCVRDALARYFATLDGHDCSDLFDLVIGEVEIPLLEIVLEHADGNQTKAAKMLGINRGTLRKKLQQYDLS